MIRALTPAVTPAARRPDTEPDWLTHHDDPRTLAWAEAQTARTSLRYAVHPAGRALRAALEADAGTWCTDLVIAGVPHRIVRDAGPGRSRVERRDRAGWRPVIDLAQWHERGSEEWLVIAVSAAPGCRLDGGRALVVVSPRGNDERRTLEVDLATGQPVPVEDGGFAHHGPGGLVWAGPDAVLAFVAHAPDDLTHAGHPRRVRWWRRGEASSEARVVATAAVQEVTITAQATPSGLVLARRHRRDGRDRFDLSCPRLKVQIPLPACATAHLLDTGVFLTAPHDGEGGGLRHLPVSVSREGLPIIGELETVLSSADAVAARGVARRVVPTEGAVALVVVVDGLDRVWRCRRDADGEWSVDEPDTAVRGTVDRIVTGGGGTVVRWSSTVRAPRRSCWRDSDPGSALTPRRSEAWVDSSPLGRLERHRAISADGAPVTYFLTLPPAPDPGGVLPVLLLGYGGFGACLTPRYAVELEHGWLRRGGAVAIAQLRGGGERGPHWREAGLGTGKQGAVDDLEAVAADLSRRGVSEPERIAVQGVSNGGLVAALLVLTRPHRVGAAALHNAVLDLTATHGGDGGWRSEYAVDPASGDPRELSPLHRVVAPTGSRTPPVLVTAERHDDRVDPTHSRTFVHRLAATGHPVWYREGAGTHRGPLDADGAGDLLATTYAFLWDAVGGC